MAARPSFWNVTRVWANFAPIAPLINTTAVAPVIPGMELLTWLVGVISAWRALTRARVDPKSSVMEIRLRAARTYRPGCRMQSVLHCTRCGRVPLYVLPVRENAGHDRGLAGGDRAARYY